MQPTILLFDIDGTLITTGGVGRRALQRAFEARFGAPNACRFPFDGMTDRRILRQGIQALGQSPTDALISELLELYLELLDDEIARADVAQYRVHPGMVRAVEAGRQRSEVAVGLGTGNIREGARLKLEKVSLHDHFSFGGFGCDHEDCPSLIRVGAERGALQLGVPLSECRVVIIGDTPKDVAAAQALGAESIGVGTGSYTPAQLLESGATAAFADLSAPGALDAVLKL